MASSTKQWYEVIRRRLGSGSKPLPKDSVQSFNLGGTNRRGTLVRTDKSTDELGRYDDWDQQGYPNGRTGNDWMYPDRPRGYFQNNTDPGDRLQDFANTHLSEGPNPGRIPRPWNNRNKGKLGRDLTGNPAGGIGFESTSSGQSGASGGIGDMMYVPHTPIPRGSIVARAYRRTVDDAAQVPAVYVADPTRR